MTIIKSNTVQMSDVQVTVAEISHRDKRLLYTEHAWNGGVVDSTLKNPDGAEINDPILVKEAQALIKNNL